MNIIRHFFQYLVKRNLRWLGLYKKLFKLSGDEYSDILKHHNYFHSIGEHCFIVPDTVITDPKFVKIGDNVTLASCRLFGHDGSVNVLNRAYNLKLDAVGKIEIGDNVFIGNNAIILRNVVIGSNSIVAAGAVVTSNVSPNSVVGGVPAKFICTTDELVLRLKKENETLPWIDLIEKRKGAYDAALEPLLNEMRENYFYMN